MIQASILNFILTAALTILFSLNGLGVTTWQYWVLLLGMFFSHILGIVRMMEYE